jgi:hypothetical protein
VSGVELLFDVWVAGWEIECCRDLPAVGQKWEEIVTLGRDAGHLWEDRHGDYLSGDESELDACFNHSGRIEKLWIVPRRVVVEDGITTHYPGDGPGSEVTEVDPKLLDASSVRMRVWLPGARPRRRSGR